MSKGTIIFTFDDVLAFSSYHLYEYLLANFNKYNHILDLFQLRSKEDIYNRKEINLLDMLLIKDDIGDIKNSLIAFACLSIFKDYYSEVCCDHLLITNIAKKVLKNPIFSETGGIEKIVILFKYRTDEEKNIKLKFIKDNFNHPKLEIQPILLNEKYSDYINKKYANWNLFVTDDIDEVEELSKTNIDHKEFLLPEFGYNKAKPELLELIKQKSGSISYYKIENM